MYRTRAPWFWPLFRLPFGGTIELTDEGIAFPGSGMLRAWREGDSVSMKRGLLGRIQLSSADGSKHRTIGLTWPWNSSEVARELHQYREAGLRRLLDELTNDLRATGHAITSKLSTHYVPHRLAESWFAFALKARPLFAKQDAEWIPPDLRPHLAAISNLASAGPAAIDAADAAFIATERPRLAALPHTPH